MCLMIPNLDINILHDSTIFVIGTKIVTARINNVCMCVCIYIYIYTHIYTYIFEKENIAKDNVALGINSRERIKVYN